MTVIEEVAAERERQKSVEGWSTAHDDEHADGGLASAAACYALPEPDTSDRVEMDLPPRGECRVLVTYPDVPMLWPRSWHSRWWKPKDRRRNLIRAAALLVAEIERLDRVAQKRAA